MGRSTEAAWLLDHAFVLAPADRFLHSLRLQLQTARCGDRGTPAVDSREVAAPLDQSRYQFVAANRNQHDGGGTHASDLLAQVVVEHLAQLVDDTLLLLAVEAEEQWIVHG